MKKYFEKGLYISIFVAILAVGIFLRGYNFSDWLHFEIDQARDARIISQAVDEGLGNLPLLGPRAAGTFLRLGPMFYYMEYTSAKIFGGTPPAMAYSILFFSVLTLPLFYFFSRRYFSRNLSLGLMLLLAVSLFMIMYSRFGWNPNTIPFFALLAFYSLLRVVDREENNRKLWVYIFALAIAIVTQLHFLAFIAIPAISVVFLLIKRPNIKFKTWGIALLIIIAFYIPPIINDIKTGGDNMSEFIEAITGKPSDEDHTLAEKGIRNLTNHANNYFIILTGNEKTELPKVSQIGSLKFDIKCDQDCRNNLILGAIAIIVFISGFFLLIRNLIKEKNVLRKDFLVLTFLWIIIPLGLYTPIAFDLSPRFYLVTAPIAFIFLGFIIRFMTGKIYSKKGKLTLLVGMIAIFAASNLYFAKNRFDELEKAPTENVKISTDRILKERGRVTLEQQLMIVDYIKKFYKKNKYPIYHHSDAQYRRSFVYHLEQLGIDNDGLKTGTIYKSGNHFLILRASSDQEDRTRKFKEKYDILEIKKFGTMVVYHFGPKPEFVTHIEQDFSAEERASSTAPRRYKWNEIFEKGKTASNEDEKDNDE
ncbi:ArnT family glycosyltransferase [Patescibacteria group bacterium]